MVAEEGAPAPSAAPAPSPPATRDDLHRPRPAPSRSPAPGRGRSPEPAPSAAPSPSPAPTASATPVQSDSDAVREPLAQLPPTEPPVDGVPAWVFDEAKVAFEAGEDSGRLEVHGTDGNFEFSVVLDDAPRSPTYSFALDMGGLEARLAADGRTVELVRTTIGEGAIDETVAGVVRAPVLLDANGLAAPPETVTVSLYRPGVDPVAPDGLSAGALTTVGPTEIVLTYAIDPAGSPAQISRSVVLDPSVCIQVGGSGCHPDRLRALRRLGRAERLPGPALDAPGRLRRDHQQRRDLGPPPGSWSTSATSPCPTGAQVIGANLDLRETNNPSTARTRPRSRPACSTSRGAGTHPYDDVEWAWLDTWNSPNYSPCDNGATDCTLSMNVEKIVRAWYTRRGQDWQPNMGFYLFHDGEPTSWGETDFYLSSNPTVSNRPQADDAQAGPAAAAAPPSSRSPVSPRRRAWPASTASTGDRRGQRLREHVVSRLVASVGGEDGASEDIAEAAMPATNDRPHHPPAR